MGRLRSGIIRSDAEGKGRVMPNLLRLGRRSLSIAGALVLCLVAYGQEGGDPNNGFGPNNRPVYAFLSVADTFSLPFIDKVDRQLRVKAATLGSKMIRLKIGTFVGGDQIETTRFLSDGPVLFDPLSVPP